jgi:hypothetical protein
MPFRGKMVEKNARYAKNLLDKNINGNSLSINLMSNILIKASCLYILTT